MKSSWTLSLDADERVSEELKTEIEEVLSGDDAAITGYWIPRKNFIFGKWIQHSLWWPDNQLRLFKTGKGKFSRKSVHEPITVEGETKILSAALIHQNYTSIAQYLYKMDAIYTENEASKLFESGKKVTWVDALRFPANDFLKTFFLQKGYKDGMHGLVLSMLQAFYSFLVFAKVWEKQGFPEGNPPGFLKQVISEMKRIGSDFRYWFYTSLIDETKSPMKRHVLRVIRKTKKKA